MKNKNFYSVIIVGLSTFIAGILSYIYHPIMIRFLDLKEFAEFQTQIGLINIFGVFISTISLFFVKELSKSKDTESFFLILNFLKKIGIYLGIIFGFFLILFSPLISFFLKLENFYIVIFSGLILVLSFFGMYQNVFFQVKKRVLTISFLNIINPFLRIVISIFLIFIGFKIFGAIGGFIFTQIILIFIGFLIINKGIKKNIFNKEKLKKINNEIKKNILSQKKQIFHFLFSSIILALFMNIDILIAKNFFETEKVGIYAGISIIAKFLIFIGMSIETVYYPVFVSENFINKKKFLLLSGFYIFIILGAILFFYLFGIKILHLFKPGFENYLDLLYLIIIYCGILSILNFLVKILIAFEKYFINYLLSFVFIIFIIILYFFTNNSFYNFINIFNIFILTSLIFSFIYLFLIKNEK